MNQNTKRVSPGVPTTTQLVEKLTTENTVHDGSEASFRLLHSLYSPAEAEVVNDLLSEIGIRSMARSGGSDALSPLLFDRVTASRGPVRFLMHDGFSIRPPD